MTVVKVDDAVCCSIGSCRSCSHCRCCYCFFFLFLFFFLILFFSYSFPSASSYPLLPPLLAVAVDFVLRSVVIIANIVSIIISTTSVITIFKSRVLESVRVHRHACVLVGLSVCLLVSMSVFRSPCLSTCLYPYLCIELSSVPVPPSVIVSVRVSVWVLTSICMCEFGHTCELSPVCTCVCVYVRECMCVCV